MPKFIFLTLTILFVLNLSANAQERFAQYRKIEAYEVRPGILMIPRYTVADEVCEIGLEKLLYSPSVVSVDTELSREEIFKTLNELVPINERGTPAKDVENEITVNGSVRTWNIGYENVLIRIYGAATQWDPKHKNELGVATEVLATVTWKNRTCR